MAKQNSQSDTQAGRTDRGKTDRQMEMQAGTADQQRERHNGPTKREAGRQDESNGQRGKKAR